ncbi:MAG: hypothetical protein NTW32_03485 [Chloroflexi bacterium]|nr:hypothetical protein [Chloroflexota bacterium]
MKIILGLMVLPDMPAWYSTAPTGLIVLQLAGLIGVLSLVGLWLERKSVILVL